MTCVIQITGDKDVGKTILAEWLVERLKAGGHTVVVVKISHHDPEPPHKDTARLRRAGADRVLFYNGDVYVLYSRGVSCRELEADFVIVEGLRHLKVGYKIHIGPNPPPDVDLWLSEATPIEVKCVEVDPCHLLSAIASHKPK